MKERNPVYPAPVLHKTLRFAFTGWFCTCFLVLPVHGWLEPPSKYGPVVVVPEQIIDWCCMIQFNSKEIFWCCFLFVIGVRRPSVGRDFWASPWRQHMWEGSVFKTVSFKCIICILQGQFQRKPDGLISCKGFTSDQISFDHYLPVLPGFLVCMYQASVRWLPVVVLRIRAW